MSKIVKAVPQNKIEIQRLSDGRVEIIYLNGIHQYISSSAVPALLAALLENAGAREEWAIRESWGLVPAPTEERAREFGGEKAVRVYVLPVPEDTEE